MSPKEVWVDQDDGICGTSDVSETVLSALLPLGVKITVTDEPSE
jgi:hypothetical protein